jgi:hypothetical protein
MSSWDFSLFCFVCRLLTGTASPEVGGPKIRRASAHNVHSRSAASTHEPAAPQQSSAATLSRNSSATVAGADPMLNDSPAGPLRALAAAAAAASPAASPARAPKPFVPAVGMQVRMCLQMTVTMTWKMICRCVCLGCGTHHVCRCSRCGAVTATSIRAGSIAPARTTHGRLVPCACAREIESLRDCDSVCVRVRVRACVCVCVCVYLFFCSLPHHTHAFSSH